MNTPLAMPLTDSWRAQGELKRRGDLSMGKARLIERYGSIDRRYGFVQRPLSQAFPMSTGRSLTFPTAGRFGTPNHYRGLRPRATSPLDGSGVLTPASGRCGNRGIDLTRAPELPCSQPAPLQALASPLHFGDYGGLAPS